MIPGWVDGPDAFYRWMEQVLDASGAELVDPHYLAIDHLGLTEVPGVGEIEGLLIARHRLRFFADDSILDFRMRVEFTLEFGEFADLEVPSYRFHYMAHDETFIWRYDKHSGHESEFDGSPIHLHHPTEDERKPSPEVDLDDVINVIRHEHLNL